MRLITIILVAIITVNVCLAEDDGRYRPEIYEVERYPTFYNNRYNDLLRRNSKYNSIYNGYYNPFSLALNRGLQSPLHINYGDSVEIHAADAYPSTVTYRTPAVPITTTNRPLILSTPKPSLVTKPPTIYHRTFTDQAANIIRQDVNANENSYQYAFETDNGIAAQESGVVDSSVNGGGGTRVIGFYEYIGDDGRKYRVDYTADENGFRASGAHLPKVPGTI